MCVLDCGGRHSNNGPRTPERTQKPMYANVHKSFILTDLLLRDLEFRSVFWISNRCTLHRDGAAINRLESVTKKKGSFDRLYVY